MARGRAGPGETAGAGAAAAERALAAADALLSLVSLVPLPPDRVSFSGLVQQQALLHRQDHRAT